MKAVLADGQFNINGVVICPKTSVSDLQHSGLDMKCKCFTELSRATFYGQTVVLADQTPFTVEIHFLDKTIFSMLLRPYMQHPPKMTDVYERQQLRYVACSRWLFLRLEAHQQAACHNRVKIILETRKNLILLKL